MIRLIRTTKGRNKIMGLIQYIAKFSAACIIYTIDKNNITTDKLSNIE
jgi:hypothetical protein